MQYGTQQPQQSQQQPVTASPSVKTQAVNMGKLSRLVDFSRRRLEPFRRKRLEMLRHFVGMHYSENGSTYAIPINVMSLAVSIYLRQLVSRSPRFMVKTQVPQAKPVAMGMEAFVNQQIVEQGVERTLRLAALDALFSVGILKSGVCAGGRIEYDNVMHEYGYPFLDPIDLDDWVHDMNCKRREQWSFAGHRFRMLYDDAIQNDQFDPKARKGLTPSYISRTNEAGDERVETLTHDVSAAGEYFEQFVECYELWLPKDQLIVTVPVFSDGSVGSTPLRVQEWVGPKIGPFHWLEFMPVPGQTMPSAPVHHWYDLADIINRVMIKCGEQAERQKTILGIQGTAEADGRRVIEANDGEGIKMDYPDGTREFRFGGVDQQNMAFLMQTKSLFGYAANNLDAIGGLATGADTLGQDQMLTANASKTLQSMQEDMIAFTTTVGRAFGWYFWTDPFQVYHADVSLPGHPDNVAQIQITPEMRRASALTSTFELDPHSLRHGSPSDQLQGMMGLINLVAPAMGVMAQQGVAINWRGIIMDYCKFRGLPNPENYVTFLDEATMQAMQQGGGGGAGPAAPAAGKPGGKYTRTNITSPQSQETQMVTAMIQNSGRNS